ncbi:MAG: membrane protein insertase YidC [Actinomycetota bacterium]|nr:membrane protein insertase YidC [Actinomycetota bacterium]
MFAIAGITSIIQPLIDVFESVLKFFHNSAGVSWGFSIVLLTVVIRAILLPLTLKQFRSMQALQLHQPELKALQAKYKEDKKRQQEEVMKFYKENKVNPFGSCLPLVLQLPVFISLFYMLRGSLTQDICPRIQLAYQHLHHVSASHTTPCGVGHGAGFLFIGDLTSHAVGVTMVVLIILYVGTQLTSSLLMQTPTMDKTQRKIMLFMPLVFVFFIIRYPSGLLVYWITTNAWTIAQQYIVRKRMGPIAAPVAAVADGPPGARPKPAGGRPAGLPPKPARAEAGGASPKSLRGATAGSVPKANGADPSRPATKRNGGPPSSPAADPNSGVPNGSLGERFAGLWRGRAKGGEAPVAVAAGPPPRSAAPPRSPKKRKKKRSGRRK